MGWRRWGQRQLSVPANTLCLALLRGSRVCARLAPGLAIHTPRVCGEIEFILILIIRSMSNLERDHIEL